MRCGEAIVRLLQRYGADTVFGIPGVHTLEYYRGFAERGIRSILTRHEQGAGFMADGYARATGRPGVCCVITGPGVTNAATPIGQAYSDSIPMLVLASVNRTSTLGKGFGDLHESTDQLAIVRPLAGLARNATRPDDVPDFFRRAFSSFAAERPRPAYLQVPIDVLAEDSCGDWEAEAVDAPPGPDREAIRAAATLLRAAERPALLLGGGTVDAVDSARSLAERIGAPVVMTVAGKGVVPESDPLSLGASMPYPAVQTWLAERDVVLAIGTELAETDMWSRPIVLGSRLIRVDIDPAQLAGRYRAEVSVLSDAGRFCDELLVCLDELGAPSPLYQNGASEAAELRAASPDGNSVQYGVLRAIRAGLPADARVYTDMTQIAYTGNRAFPVDMPRRWFHPLGFGTLGYALPAAIGGAVADPGTPTAALVGDAGLLFTVQEMATAAELNLPLVVILWNNDGLGQILGDMVEMKIPPTSVLARNPDFLALARSFGWRATAPTSTDELEQTLHCAASEPGPLLVEVRERVFAGD